MTFTSLEFGLLLLVTLVLFYSLPQRGRIVLLVVSSYVFYGFWHPYYGWLMFLVTVLNYAAALSIESHTSSRRRTLALWASVGGSLGLLAYFKYTNFALDSLRALLGPLGANLPGPLSLVLPVGISFYTFQMLSYVVDVYRRQQAAERDFLLVALYIVFFPQLVAGPIERAHDLIPQFRVRQSLTVENIEEGCRLILWGLLKKLVVADRLTLLAMPIYENPSEHGFWKLLFAGAGMFVVVYLDFSAYSEIAMGSARLFGIRLTHNFRFPHAAGNIAEHWRRWHITMSTLVRDYVFRPLGGFRPRNLVHHIRVTLMTMFLVGLWHGAQWTFVLWGLIHGIYLAAYHVLYLKVLRRLRGRPFMAGVSWRLGSWFLTTIARIVPSVIFFSPDLKRASIFLNRLFLHPAPGGMSGSVQVGLVSLVGFWLFHYWHSTGGWPARFITWSAPVRGALYGAGVFVLLFGGMPRQSPFIYFQF